MQQRYHALDSLRGVMMLLGVVLHAAINYVHFDIPVYFYKDPQVSLSMDILVFVIHTFRMPTFFVMAGFFAALLYFRRSQREMLENRFKRIVLPFVVFWPILFFLSVMIFLLSIHWVEYGTWGIEFTLVEKYSDSTEQKELPTMHLWFLQYLIFFYLLSVPSFWLLGKLPGLAAVMDRVFAFLLRTPLGLIVFTLPIAVVGYFYPAGAVEIDGSFKPDSAQLLYHGGFFVVGWYLYKEQYLIEQYRRYWCLYTVGALLCIFITMVGLGMKEEGDSNAQYIVAWFANFSTWVCIFALIGGFERFLSGYSAVRRYLTDSSYWIYLIHTLFTIGIAVLMRDVAWSAEMKFLAVTLSSSVICLLSYHFLVRGTVLGLFLNGRKY